MSVNVSLIKDRMLEHIAQSNAFFKSQQQDEKDLTVTEKRELAESLLERNMVLFLQRFHKFLNIEDLQYFDPHTDSYEVNFYLKEALKENDEKKRKLKVKNRRYAAMQRLIKEGEYFSDVNMRERMPYLYDQMIGQYLTEEEKAKALPENTDVAFSSFLMSAMEKQQEERVRKSQRDAEEQEEEEEESDDSSEEDVEMEESESQGPNMKTTISGEEKQQLRHEFTTLMIEQFLSGKDTYDYRSIDDNAELDSHQICDIDEEEKYFDSEDAS